MVLIVGLPISPPTLLIVLNSLTTNYQDELWELVVNTAEESRLNLMEFIATFNRVDMASTFDGLKNLIVWFACEFYAYQLTDY